MPPSSIFNRRIVKKVEKKPKPVEHMLVASTEQPGFGIRSLDIMNPEARIRKPVSGAQLEKLYILDPLTFRIVQKYVEEILGDGYLIQGGGSKERQEVQEWLDTRIDIEYLASEIIKDCFVTGAGNAWCELGYNKAGNNILSIRMINPKSGIDFIKDDSKDVIKYDEDMNPLGYKLGSPGYPEIKWTKNKIIVNGKVVWKNPGNQDGRDRIAHFKLIGLGEDEYGLSPLAPGYKAALVRLNIEDVIGNISFRKSSIVAKLGDENQPPESVTDEQLKTIQDQLRQADSYNVFTFRRNVDIDEFPTPDIKELSTPLYYLADLYCSGLGVKLGLILQPPQGSYRGDIEIAREEFRESVVVQLRKSLEKQIRDKFFKRFLKARGYDPLNAPYIEFIPKQGRLGLEKSRRIATYARRGLIKYDPLLEKYIRELEGLPTEFVEKLIERWKRENKTPEDTKEIDITQR